MIIDITSFVSGPRQIENASGTDTPNTNQLAVSKAVNGYIEYYEPIYLSEMLGSSLANQVSAYASVEHKPLPAEVEESEEEDVEQPTEEGADTPQTESLDEGEVLEGEGETTETEETETPAEGTDEEPSEDPAEEPADEDDGLEYEDPKMESLIALLKESCADYVFFHILRDMNTQATITGLVRLKCANDYASPLDRGVRIWNNMVKRNRTLLEQIKALGFDVTVDKNMLSSINTFNL